MRRRHIPSSYWTWIISFSALLFALTLAACGPLSRGQDDDLPDWESVPDLRVQSAAFANGSPIPVDYTCDGQNISPPLEWSEPPDRTESFTLIVDDPDAPRGTVTHWIVFNIPSHERSLPEGAGVSAELPQGTLPGDNGRGEHDYRGPCPPEGEEHNYRFTLYALDRSLDLPAGTPRGELIEQVRDQIVGGSQLTGTYKRR